VVDIIYIPRCLIIYICMCANHWFC
jgi:hypothetical protein